MNYESLMDPNTCNVPVLAAQQEFIYISSVRTQDVVWKTFRKRWMIRIDGELESEKSVLSVRLDDDMHTRVCVCVWERERERERRRKMADLNY